MHEFIKVINLSVQHFGSDISILNHNDGVIYKRKFFGIVGPGGTDEDEKYPIGVLLEDEARAGTFWTIRCDVDDCCLVEV